MKRKNRFTLYLSITFCFGGLVYGNQPVYKYRHCKPSKINLLQNHYFESNRGEYLYQALHKRSELSRNLRILAILVDFQTDEDERTTGNGQFNLSITDIPMIDSPPHDIRYFESQLMALTNYFQSVSRGKLNIQYQVVDHILTLPHEMRYYNPGTTDEKTDQGLAEFFHDSILLADSADVLFSEFNAYILFHAGVGRDIDLGYDITPSDIPSAFLNIDDLETYLTDRESFDHEGIRVENGSFHISEGIILPETESQDGIQLGLLGTMTIMFGFQLGLPALWNTRTGLSGIGKWGLMDQGSGNYYGLIPAEPCAWSKIYLGWVDPIVVRYGNDLSVACSKANHGNQIYKIPIDEHEYFLIENRQYDPIQNRIDDTLVDSITVGWDVDGQPITFFPNGQLSDTLGIIVRVEEYDYDLPGSGILIWHIDEHIIQENFASNTINNDKNHRGVDLEEADGAQDIGELYGFFSGGAGSETGVMHDAWFQDNEINLLVNQSDSVVFSSNTYPNSRTYSGANSHIVISDFSEIDTVMTFSVKSDWLQKGFPVIYSSDLDPFPPLYGDIDGDDQNEIIIPTRAGKIFCWNHDGTPVISDNPIEFRVSVTGDTLFYQSGLFLDIGKSLDISPIILGESSLDQFDDLCLFVEDRLITYRYQNKNIHSKMEWSGEYGRITAGISVGDHLAIGTENSDVIWFDLGSGLERNSNLSGGAITGFCQCSVGSWSPIGIGSDQGQLILLNTEDGVIQATIDLHADSIASPAAAILHESDNGSMEITGEVFGYSFVITTSVQGGYIVNGTRAEDILSFGQHLLLQGCSEPSLGDIDDDGSLEVVVSSGSQVWAFNYNGSLCNHFPTPSYERDLELSSPVLGDVNGDGLIEILVVTTDGNLEAYHGDGSSVPNFPFPAGGELAVSPSLFDLDQDGDVEIVVVSDGGMVNVWDLSGFWTEAGFPWGSVRHDPYHSSFNPQNPTSQTSKEELMVSNLVYNYPNPTEGNFTTIRYRLEKPASVWIKIFDLAGELVDEFRGPGYAQTENEVVWDLSDVESGVYFCQVKATDDHKEKNVIFKIGVVK